MNTPKTDLIFRVEPAPGVQFEPWVTNWARLAGVVIVEPDRSAWVWGQPTVNAALKLDDRLVEWLSSDMNLIYVMSAQEPGGAPLFYELCHMARVHTRGWHAPGAGALSNLRRWLQGLKADTGHDPALPVAVVGAVLEDDVMRAANAVAAAGWPVVVVTSACLPAPYFRHPDHRPRARRTRRPAAASPAAFASPAQPE